MTKLFSATFLATGEESEPKAKKKPQHHIDYRLTIQSIMKKIRSDFPPTFKSLRNGDFVKNSRSFVDSLLSSPTKLSQVLETLPSHCEFCSTALENWSFKNPKSFFLTLGHIKEIKIHVKICKTCQRSYYPDFYQLGLLFIHNKFVVTIEALLDILNSLKNDGSLIATIKDKLLLLGQLEGLSDELKKDLTNNSLKLEKVVIAVSSILVKGEDLDDVTCWLCGNCPKCVSTDGNTKDSIKVQSNMVFDYEDEGIIPDLNEFTDELIEEVLCSAFFQHKSEKKFNMLKLPSLIAPCLLREQINNEREKKTIMEKQYEYTDETIDLFQDLVQKKEIRLNGIKDINAKELGVLGAKLKLSHDKKSGEMIKIDLINLSKILLGGQVTRPIK